MAKMIIERSPDTDAVASVLRDANGEISYETIARKTKLPIDRVKAVNQSAQRILLKEGITFSAIRGFGLKRLTDQDKVIEPESRKKRMRRAATLGLKRLETISDFGRLTQAEQHSVTINRTIFNVIRSQAMTKTRTDPPKIAPQPMPNVSKLIPRKKV
jgi:hypothetical protein